MSTVFHEQRLDFLFIFKTFVMGKNLEAHCVWHRHRHKRLNDGKLFENFINKLNRIKIRTFKHIRSREEKKKEKKKEIRSLARTTELSQTRSLVRLAEWFQSKLCFLYWKIDLSVLFFSYFGVVCNANIDNLSNLIKRERKKRTAFERKSGYNISIFVSVDDVIYTFIRV